jgi:predicted RNA-binding Zn-ribbon protein involved in translation (DUF1610 family)
MIPEIQAGIASAKASFDLLKAIKGVSDAAKINAAVIELQQHILSAQQSLLDAQETINLLTAEKAELESRLAKHSEWETRRSEYHLTEVRPGLTVYAFQPATESEMAPHWACPKCFADEKIQILQKPSPSNRTYKCPACEFSMIPDKELPNPIRVVQRRQRNWMDP